MERDPCQALAGGVSKRKIAMGPVQQPDDMGTALNAAEEARRAEQDTNQRIAALSTSLQRNGVRPIQAEASLS